MKKNAKLDAIRKKTPREVKLMIDHSFAIVDRIDEIMKKRPELTQRTLAEMLGKCESEISKWMRGTHNFTLKTIAKLEATLGEPILQFAERKPAILVLQVQNGATQQMFAVRGEIGVKSDNTKQIYTPDPNTELVVNEFTEQYN